MILVAFFLFLGGFGAGGPLPVNMFNGVYWALGWAAYFAPVALVFFGVHKFRSPDHQIPLSKFVSMTAFLVASAAWFQVAFVTVSDNGEVSGGHGGAVGQAIGNTTLNALNKVPASLLFFVASVLLAFLSFGISPKVLVKPFALFKRKKKDDTDLNSLKQPTADQGLRLNEGVPVVHHKPGEVAAGLGAATAVAKKLAPDQHHEALTTPSNPDWEFPSLDLLNQKQDKADAGDVNHNAEAIKDTLANFGISVDMESANIGPQVTQYTLKPDNGVKMNKIAALNDDLAYALAAQSLRIEAPIPGKRLVGVEVPNQVAATVRISSIFKSDTWLQDKHPLTFAIGKDITGNAVVSDLSDMPHLLIAGATKSGKSIMINSILTSFLYRNSPADLKLILVDAKLVELKPYDDIPHLLSPVITDAEKCVSALKWTVAEMERRYKALSEVHRRNIEEYNTLKKEEGMPYIVIIIDELNDLMTQAGRDIEALIVRIAQKARAVGIHLILATQRPSVDVITGLIKANVPARIAFATTSQVDSRTIIDQIGAEKLLGKGDMLLRTSDMPKPKRLQGAFVSSEETHKITEFIREQQAPRYDDEVISQPVQLSGRGGVASADIDASDEPIFEDAVRVVIEAGKASTSLLQRRLRIGYGKAARLIETMEEQGIVGHQDGSRPREVLVQSMDDVFGGKSNVDEAASVQAVDEEIEV